ncbi:MAG: glycosyltransferase family 2 protein [Chlamydiia bacterium]|nr:glycosyltransferase family 2 protein [Chlamydiia bacterium]
MTLSVILPNYNHASLLKKALEAIITQSYPPDEIVLIDDGSTDNSLDVIASFQKRFPNLRLIQNEKNLGPVPTINRGVKEARGELLAFCSADDFILPGFFEKGVSVMQQHPELALCCGKAAHFEAQTPKVLIPDQMPDLGKELRLLLPKETAALFRNTTFFIHTNCTIYRKKPLFEYGGLNPKLKSLCDWYLSCQIALHHPIAYLPSLMAAFRLDEASYSKSTKRASNNDEMFHALMEQILSEGSEWKHAVASTGMLSHAGIQMVLFLMREKKYRKFFPKAFLKKCQFHYHHLFRRGDPLKAGDLDNIS